MTLSLLKWIRFWKWTWLCCSLCKILCRFTSSYLLGSIISHLGLQPKKLKLDDVLKQSEGTSSTNNELKKLISEIRSNPLKDDMGDLIYQKRVFKRPVLSMDSVNVTSTDGDRVYLRLQPSNSQVEDMVWLSYVSAWNFRRFCVKLISDKVCFFEIMCRKRATLQTRFAYMFF